MKKISYIIRVLTTPPIMAMGLCLWLYACPEKIIPHAAGLWVSLIALGLFPLSAYILQPILPHVKHKGREGQRSLAMIFCFLGYLAGLIYALAADAGEGMVFLFLTYLLSGVGMLICNKLLRLRASGHACGLAGPVAMLCLMEGMYGMLSMPVYIAGMLASLQMKRHTAGEWLLGSALSPLSLLASLLILSL